MIILIFKKYHFLYKVLITQWYIIEPQLYGCAKCLHELEVRLGYVYIVYLLRYSPLDE